MRKCFEREIDRDRRAPWSPLRTPDRDQLAPALIVSIERVVASGTLGANRAYLLAVGPARANGIVTNPGSTLRRRPANGIRWPRNGRTLGQDPNSRGMALVPLGIAVVQAASMLGLARKRDARELDQACRTDIRVCDVIDADLAESSLGIIVAGWDHAHDRQPIASKRRHSLAVEPAHGRRDQCRLGPARRRHRDQVTEVIAALNDDGPDRANLARLQQRGFPRGPDAGGHESKSHGEPPGASDR
jgi:hypothetical protein